MGTLRVLSYSGERFKNRAEAGRQLAAELEEYRGKNAVVLGIPRGGVIVARELADGLDAELDIVLAHKLRTPGFPELAMGSIAEGGKFLLNEPLVRELGIRKEDIEIEKKAQTAEIARRSEVFRRVRSKVPLQGKTVIITDDGVATGATFQAALWAARAEKPEKLIAAIPVGAAETLRRLVDDTDETLCLRVPLMFAAVGQFYEWFDAIEDGEVLKILSEEHARKARK